MLKNVITLPGGVARWVRRKAAAESISVSKLVVRMLENQMRLTDEYHRAHQRWRQLAKPVRGVDAAQRLSREESHERR